MRRSASRWPRMLERGRILMLAAAGVLAAGACAGPPPNQTLLVGAASGLARTMPHLAEAFETQTGIRVAVSLTSSGHLARQIIEGAPVDVFLSADRRWVERLAGAGRTSPDGRAAYARGRLALVTAPHRDRIGRLEELGDVGVGRVAIANPEHAPYGRAAREALARAGVWDRIQDRIVITENVRQALQMVGTGNVDAAIAATALMNGEPAWTPVPEELHSPLIQEAAVVTGRPSEAAARAFLRFLTGPEGQRILRRHGFLTAGDT